MDNNILKPFVYFFTLHGSNYGFCIGILTHIPTYYCCKMGKINGT